MLSDTRSTQSVGQLTRYDAPETNVADGFDIGICRRADGFDIGRPSHEIS
ncbi:MAG: hypothetical protein Q7S08_04165 [bacterium]|nr:hypothetical protein [bacterium]